MLKCSSYKMCIEVSVLINCIFIIFNKNNYFDADST